MKNITTIAWMLLLLLGLPGTCLAGYTVSPTSTTSGGGTWGSILRMSVSVSGTQATFTVAKQSGTFTSAGTIYLKEGSITGTNRASRSVSQGASSTTLSLNLSSLSGYPKSFYARYEASIGGYAWVGPITVSFSNRTPSAPSISSSPSTAKVGMSVSIAVTRGTDADGDRVKVQCTAADSNWSSPAYDSGLSTAGTTVTPSFVFNAAGTKTIYCTSFDEYGGGSSTSSRTISVTANRAPTTPIISSSPSSARVGVSVGIPVTRGTDADGDQVKVQCTAIDSNRSSPPYDSGLGTGGSGVTPTFVFSASGTKTIYCTSFDSLGAGSPTSSRTITVTSNQAPTPPIISSSPTTAFVGSSVSISVTRGTDGDGDRVKVQCTANDSNWSNPPYDSGLSTGGTVVTPAFVFNTTGTKTIYCTSFDEFGAGSTTPQRTIQVNQSTPTGSITSPTGSVIGPVRVVANVSVPSGIQKVSVVFYPHGIPFVLCQDGTADPCPATNGNWDEPAVDPRWYSAPPGSLPVGLWVRDDLGVETLVNQRTITWQPASTGSLTAPTGSGAGMITVAGSASSSAGLKKVSVVFVQHGTPLVLCEDGTANPCPASPFNWSRSDVLPRDFSVSGAAALNLGLWVLDDAGRVENVDRRDFSWAPAGSGSITSPSGTVTGPVRILANASAPQGLKKVSVVFVEGGTPFVLCEDGTATPCTAQSWDRSGIDPRTYGVQSPGPLDLGLWIRDDLGRTDRVARQSITWQAPISESTGTISSPAGSVTGNVTLTATAADPDGLKQVSVSFVPNGTRYVLCEDGTANACQGTSGNWTRAGIDPRSYGVSSAGQVTLSLWVKDDLERSTLVHEKAFTWAPSAQPTYLNVSDWAQAAAHYLVTRGIVTDPPSHDLRGTSDVNRAELATMIYRSLGSGLSADANFASWYGGAPTPRFVDVVDPAVWYFKPVSYLGGLEFGDGITVFDQQVGIFRPANPISKAWSVKALLEAWDIKPLTSFSGVSLFTDVPTSHPAAGYVYQAKQKGIVTGTNGLFEPDVLVDRQDVFVMLHRMMDAQANANSQTIASPAPLSRDDFAGTLPLSRLGVRYEQPILSGAQSPTVTLTASSLTRGNVGSLTGIYSSVLDASLTGIDGGTFVDSRGITRVAHPFCAWSATSGSFIDLTPSNGIPFSRVRWLAPSDVSAASGSTMDFEITVYCGDDLGHEVRATRTLSLSSRGDDSTLPAVTLAALPTGKIGGQLLDLAGTVQDGGDANDADYGILRVELFHSLDAGATWDRFGEATLDGQGGWSFQWLLPPFSGTVQVRARATNLRGNTAQTQRSISLLATLALEGAVVDGRGQPLENALVSLTGGGLNASQAADNNGSFRFSNTTGTALATGVAYTLTVSFEGKTATAAGLTLTSGNGTLHRILILDMAPPSTAATIPGGIYSTPQTVELVCVDDHSDCESTYYTVDGSTPNASSAFYSSPISITSDTTLKFFSVDAAGNQEDVVTETYDIATCSFTIDPASQSFEAPGGAGALVVTAPAGCVWTAASGQSWIIVTSGASGDGNGTVTFNVAANPDTVPRSGTISAGGQPFTVTQGGVAMARATTPVDFDGDGTSDWIIYRNGAWMYFGPCAHALNQTGSPIDPSCSACATRICADDPVCCLTSWDQSCVDQVATVCR